KNKIFFKNINLLDKEIVNQEYFCSAKIRSTQGEIAGKLKIIDNGGYFLFDEPISATSPGQACVFYKNDQVLGGGWIT
ncbi:tRNA 2-thiouridine(34) synthase MnmA, partial [Alphaproteobacteria bacterium]|nr:tRNA 2-thiouridine(34) synthase MnmA [Alphaproteobacteria bacterium]